MTDTTPEDFEETDEQPYEGEPDFSQSQSEDGVQDTIEDAGDAVEHSVFDGQPESSEEDSDA